MQQAQESLGYIIDKIPNLDRCNALDIFAREGDWQSYLLVPKVNSLEAWEIDPAYIPNLKANLPNAVVHCRDSIQFIKETTNYKRFELLIIDNGLNCYGEDREHCEHFDVLPHIANIVADECFVIINAARKPFNYDQFPDWQSRRNAFYKVTDSSELSLEFIEDFYKKYFSGMGYTVAELYSNCREYKDGVDYLYHLGFQLTKKK